MLDDIDNLVNWSWRLLGFVPVCQWLLFDKVLDPSAYFIMFISALYWLYLFKPKAKC